MVEKIEFNNEYKFSSEIECKVKTDTIAWKHQISAADYATKGDYRNALKSLQSAWVKIYFFSYWLKLRLIFYF
ncbi:MAG: hypothetical protein ACJA1Z_001657 [Patiriisocius sp.]|jgi:hypothetical protein